MKLAKRELIVPDYCTGPKYVETFGPVVAELCAGAGYVPDPQQQLVLDRIFAVRADGRVASFAVCEICCRQNLKTGVMKMAAIGWLYVLEELDVTWSTHEMHTTRRAQTEIAELLKSSPALRKRLKPRANEGIYDANGEERIELATGQTLWFKARTRDGMRGVSGRKLVLDEAFKLTAAQLGSVLPTLMAAIDGQVLYGSSAGKADSVALRDLRDRGRKGTSKRLTYVEWCAPRQPCRVTPDGDIDPDCQHPKDAEARGMGCALDDRELWLKANPAIAAGRITLEMIEDLRQELPPEEFARECLGWWDEPDALAGVPALDVREWKRRARPSTPEPSRVAVVVEVARDRSRSSIGTAGAAPDGKVLGMVKVKPRQAWVVPQLVKMRDRLGDGGVLEVALHPSGQASTLLPQLKAEGFEVHELTHRDYARGCATVQESVAEERLVHVGQSELTAAVAVARTRYVNDAEVWDRRDEVLDLGPLVAMSTAVHRYDLLTAEPDNAGPAPRRAGKRGKTARRAGGIEQVGF